MTDLSFVHPEWVGDRHVWVDSDILRKIQFGDPTKGWEGDEYLVVFWNPLIDCFELMRWENGDYSLVARQKPGVMFDERVIEDLVARDMRRKDRYFDLHAEIEANNDAIGARAQAVHDEMVAEEVAPRLRRSLIKEGWI